MVASKRMNMSIPYTDVRRVVNMCLQYAKYKRATSDEVCHQSSLNFVYIMTLCYRL